MDYAPTCAVQKASQQRFQILDFHDVEFDDQHFDVVVNFGLKDELQKRIENW